MRKSVCNFVMCGYWWWNYADLFALSRYLDANGQTSSTSSKTITSSKQAESKSDESELRLAQLQQQLPSNEPGALMHLLEDASREDEEDLETRECKSLFKNLKFFLSREVRFCGFLVLHVALFLILPLSIISILLSHSSCVSTGTKTSAGQTVSCSGSERVIAVYHPCFWWHSVLGRWRCTIWGVWWKHHSSGLFKIIKIIFFIRFLQHLVCNSKYQKTILELYFSFSFFVCRLLIGQHKDTSSFPETISNLNGSMIA